MPGTNAGTGQPISLKCSKCKLSRNHLNFTNTGELVRTGRERPYKTSSPGPRGSRVARECFCRACGHVGWYSLREAERLPMM